VKRTYQVGSSRANPIGRRGRAPGTRHLIVSVSQSVQTATALVSTNSETLIPGRRSDRARLACQGVEAIVRSGAPFAPTHQSVGAGIWLAVRLLGWRLDLAGSLVLWRRRR